MKLKMVFMIVCMLIAQSVMAANVKLKWDASVSPNITGYKVYVGTATRTYNQPIVIGNVTTYTVKDLADGTYYFSVTAFDAQGNESAFSNEVVKIIRTVSAPTNLTGDIEVVITISGGTNGTTVR